MIASNLLGNAIDHGAADGEIRIRARCDAESFERSVWNQGDPIAQASLTKIFEPFWRQASGRGRDGLRFGLHICSQIAMTHGGSLTVTSSADAGTSFIARLPIAGSAGPGGDLKARQEGGARRSASSSGVLRVRHALHMETLSVPCVHRTRVFPTQPGIVPAHARPLPARW